MEATGVPGPRTSYCGAWWKIKMQNAGPLVQKLEFQDCTSRALSQVWGPSEHEPCGAGDKLLYTKWLKAIQINLLTVLEPRKLKWSHWARFNLFLPSSWDFSRGWVSLLPLACGSLLHALVCDPFLASLQFLASVYGHTSYFLCQVFATLLYEDCIWSPCWIMMISKYLITSAKSLMPVVPKLFGPGTSFMEDNFSVGPGRGDMVLRWFKHITFIVYFISIIITSVEYYFISIFMLYNYLYIFLYYVNIYIYLLLFSC